MQRLSTSWTGALIGISLAMLAVAESGAEAAVSRSEHCERLGLQLDQVIDTQADATMVVEATALRKQAVRFCADHKQAQGIRAYANALKLLGAIPDDSGQ